MRSLLSLANEPRSAYGLAFFRILFGCICLVATCRFAAKGWITELYVVPSFHFKYFGFSWVEPLPQPGMYALYALMGLSAAFVALGYATRAALFLFFVSFTYAELIDQTTYLNHYYLVSLLTLLLLAVDSDVCWSLSARSGCRNRVQTAKVPAWNYWVFRAQMALVYGFAGLAKLNGDWLLRAEPLKRWLESYSEVPLVGVGLGSAHFAFAASWASALFDLSVAALLLFPKTRMFSFLLLLVFHLVIWLLFPVGIFSFVMIAAATLFLSPDWPRRWALRMGSTDPQQPAAHGDVSQFTLSGPKTLLLGLYFAAQLALPLRHLLYPGWVNWTEEGFRFAWRVMLIEKTAQAEFRVRPVGSEREITVFPRDELTRFQHRQMVTQPDMIQQYARHLSIRYASNDGRPAEVFVDAWAALNGRPSQRYIDPNINLAAEPRSLVPKSWILPLDSDAVGHHQPERPQLSR